ncbi:hypothetical protein TNCV_29691 [Trichonephila clavipes]|nr:hypothetical protein TNCV_29691 [Trichonephila clavipes]
MICICISCVKRIDLQAVLEKFGELMQRRNGEFSGPPPKMRFCAVAGSYVIGIAQALGPLESCASLSRDAGVAGVYVTPLSLWIYGNYSNISSYKVNSVVQQPSKAQPRPTVPISVFVTLEAEGQEQMFLPGGQSEAKSSLFSSQARLVFILPNH